jgi:polar amino acid transport system permease protein
MTQLTAVLADIALLAKPALFNLYFAFASIPIGFLFAIFLALGKASRHGLLRRLSSSYIYMFRGSPLFIQFFMIYSMVLALNLSVWKPLGIDGIVLNPLVLGPVVLALNTTAYTAEILFGALTSVPRGEIEAARAFGFSPGTRFRRIVWPHMIRLAWPAYTNEVVFLFHATTLVYFTLPVIDDQKDLMTKAGELFQRDFNVLLHYSVAGLYFLACSLAIFVVSGLIYRRLTRHMPGAAQRWRFTLISPLR